MPVLWRVVLFIYNLLLLIVAGSVVMSAFGMGQPLAYINAAFATSQNRMMAGVVGIILVVLAIILLGWGLKFKRSAQSLVIDSNLSGEISITVPAIKTIIMRAVKKVEGIKEIRPVVSNRPDGLQIYLHLMVNPDYSMEEMGQSIQKVVKEYVEKIGGVQVAAVKILVDDFKAERK
ncbi:MAG TPA: alkaline shock response membrane anchor protein AmaP [Syntrophomonas sp.]|jgi:uncharacterized alkaline shock family protein YloU|nr:alkaline shock response membrane anchor protein AmaP [Syntrophomonas sp.]